MNRRKSAVTLPAHWHGYDDLAEVESISVAQGVALLIEHWPQERRIDTIAVKKRIRTRVEEAVARGELAVRGSGLKAQVSPREFFRWAVGWVDKRGPVGGQGPDDMSVAATRFGVPSHARIEGQLGELSGAFRGLELPRSPDAASAMAADYQRRYLDVLQENEQLREKLTVLEGELAEYRRVKEAWGKKKFRD